MTEAQRIVNATTDLMHLDIAHPFVRDGVQLGVQRLLAALALSPASAPDLLEAWTQHFSLEPITSHAHPVL